MTKHFLLLFAALLCAPLACYAATEASPMRSVFDVTDFGAIAGGETDCTAAFQQALDTAADEGGGTVWVPSGQYRIDGHLVVPKHVALKGVWESPQALAEPYQGSVLLAFEGQGDPDGTPFITMNTQSTLKGVTIFYPEQVKHNPPHPYPWTVATRSPSDNVAVLDVTMINPYQAVDFGNYPTGRHYVRGLYAHALLKGLYINQCYDVGRVENVHFWPFWDLDPASPLWEFTKTEGTAFIFGRTDGEMVSNCFSIFYSVGMHFVRGELRDGERVKERSPGSGVFTNCYMDVTPCAVLVEDVMENAGISFVNGMLMSGINVKPSNRGQVKFTGCGFWSNQGQTYHAKLHGSGTVMFESCHFSRWDQAGEGVACIEANCRRLIVNGCEFSSRRDNHVKVRLGSRVHSAIVTSNMMGSEVLIEDNTPAGASVQIGFNAGGLIEAFVEEWLAIGPFPNPPAETPQPGEPARLGLARDYLEPLGGEESSVLAPDTSVAYVTAGGGQETVRARTASVNRENILSFHRLFREGGGTAYAFCYVVSDREQGGEVLLGANDCSKAWLNGERIHDYWSDTGDRLGPTHSLDVRFKKGLNPLLIKVEDAGGRMWGVMCEVFDENGEPMATTLEKGE